MLSPSLTPISLPGSEVRIIYAPAALEHIGQIAKAEGATRILLVSDPGIVESGHVERALRSIYHAGLVARLFDKVGENPTTIHVGNGVFAARPFNPDFIIGLGGGSSMDCAKGINFLLTNGGRMQDYQGIGKATQPMLPLIAIPTTTGTGSEAQSFALISDPETHQKMACGDKKALPRIAVLDPDVTSTQPQKVAAATGIDAISHAVETAGSTKRIEISRRFSREAWQLLSTSYAAEVKGHADADIRRNMLLGAHFAGAAIENAMLGAAHACANPLTAKFGTVHGLAVGLMLPHVVRFNSQLNGNPYSDLMPSAEDLAAQIDALLMTADLPRRLRELGVSESDLPALAATAATQWTASFNPRPVQARELLEIYTSAL